MRRGSDGFVESVGQAGQHSLLAAKRLQDCGGVGKISLANRERRIRKRARSRTPSLRSRPRSGSSAARWPTLPKPRTAIVVKAIVLPVLWPRKAARSPNRPAPQQSALALIVAALTGPSGLRSVDTSSLRDSPAQNWRRASDFNSLGAKICRCETPSRSSAKQKNATGISQPAEIEGTSISRGSRLLRPIPFPGANRDFPAVSIAFSGFPGEHNTAARMRGQCKDRSAAIQSPGADSATQSASAPAFQCPPGRAWQRRDLEATAAEGRLCGWRAPYCLLFFIVVA